MATSKAYIDFVCEQLSDFDNLRYRKMFGEYMVYINDKPVLSVCDNTVFVKKLPELCELMSDTECGFPYDGAKEHYILDIEDRDTVREAIRISEQNTPLPKSAKKRT